MGTIFIHCQWLISMADGQAPVHDAYLKIVDDKIVEAGPWREAMIEPGSELIEAQDKLVMPGLINTHTHAAMVLFRSLADDLALDSWLKEKIWPLEEKLTPEDVYAGTRLAICEMLRSGTTAFADMYFFMDEVARAVEESGIRAVLARGLLGTGPEAEKKLEEAIETGKRWKGKAQGRITTMLGPHAPYTVPPEFLRQVVAASRHYQVPLHIHVAETRNELEEISKEYGKRPVAYLAEHGVFSRPVLLAHGVWLDEGEIAFLSRQKVVVAHNPSSNLKLASGFCPVERLWQAGVNVAIGTDGPASNNTLDMFREMRLAALLSSLSTRNPASLSASDAIEMATVVGAKGAGFSEVGILRSGYAADLIVINGAAPFMATERDVAEDIVYAAAGGDVQMTMVGGQILYINGNYTTIDTERAIYEARAAMSRLL